MLRFFYVSYTSQGVDFGDILQLPLPLEPPSVVLATPDMHRAAYYNRGGVTICGYYTSSDIGV